MANTKRVLEQRVRDGIRAILEGLKDAAGVASTEGGDVQGYNEIISRVRAALADFTGSEGFATTALSAVNPVALLSSAARTATTNSADQTNTARRGVVVVVDVTAVTATPEATPKIQRKNADGTYTDIFTAPAAITATGKYVYVMATDAGTASGAFAGMGAEPLPHTWRLSMSHADTDSITYSVDAWAF